LSCKQKFITLILYSSALYLFHVLFIHHTHTICIHLVHLRFFPSCIHSAFSSCSSLFTHLYIVYTVPGSWDVAKVGERLNFLTHYRKNFAGFSFHCLQHFCLSSSISWRVGSGWVQVTLSDLGVVLVLLDFFKACYNLHPSKDSYLMMGQDACLSPVWLYSILLCGTPVMGLAGPRVLVYAPCLVCRSHWESH
jgi:hypothetical protein